MTSLAAVASQQTSTSAASTTSSTQASNGLSSLSGNFTEFLNLLMTQLKNQDPTSPVDTNQFTQELVQFSQVEQQINTNSSLNTLIQLTQSGQILQGSALIGKTVEVSSTQVPLQNSQASINFNAPVAGVTTVAISNSAGVVVDNAQVNASQGANSWTWNGEGTDGSTQPDGLYTFSLNGPSATGGTQTLPFDVVGVANGVTNSSGTIDLQIGSLVTPFSNVQAVDN